MAPIEQQQTREQQQCDHSQLGAARAPWLADVKVARLHACDAVPLAAKLLRRGTDKFREPRAQRCSW